MTITDLGMPRDNEVVTEGVSPDILDQAIDMWVSPILHEDIGVDTFPFLHCQNLMLQKDSPIQCNCYCKSNKAARKKNRRENCIFNKIKSFKCHNE